MAWFASAFGVLSRRARRHRRCAGLVLLAAFSLGLAHGWLHLADGDGHGKGHFAKAANEFCLAEKLTAAVPPPVVQPPQLRLLPFRYAVVNGREICGRPASLGYFPRDPPTT